MGRIGRKMDLTALHVLPNGHVGTTAVQPVSSGVPGVTGVWSVDFEVFTLAGYISRPQPCC